MFLNGEQLKTPPENLANGKRLPLNGPLKLNRYANVAKKFKVRFTMEAWYLPVIDRALVVKKHKSDKTNPLNKKDRCLAMPLQ